MSREGNTAQMKNNLTILGAIIISLCIMISCGQNYSKQKELELKERELALKEKEFALKEKEAPDNKSMIQKTTQLSINSTPTTKDNSLNDKLLGGWKYRNSSNNDIYFRIINEGNGRFNLQVGDKFKDKFNWGEKVFSATKGEYLKYLNGVLSGKYRNWEGSAPDAYSDIKIRIEFKKDNVLLYKSEVHTGGGDSFNETHEATKIK